MNLSTWKMLVDTYKKESPFVQTALYGVFKTRPNGEFTLTTYAVNYTKTFGYRVTEVNRMWSDRPYYVCKNLWRGMWGGIHVEWDERRNRPQESYGWYEGRWSRRVNWRKDGAMWWLGYIRYINLDALQETKYRYCGYESYKGPLTLMQYVNLWKRHKELEFVSKAGLSQFATDRWIERLKRDRGLFAFVRMHLDEIKRGAENGRRFTPSTVVRAYVNRWTLEKAYHADWVRYCYQNAPKGVDREKLHDYLVKNDIDFYDYIGYCREVAAAKEDILAFGVTFPRDFHEARKKMQKRIERARAKEDRERVAALKAIAERIYALLDKMAAKLAWRTGEFSVVVPTTRLDFRREGAKMHNCIGGYFESCADGDTFCFFVNRNGKRVADVEMSPSSGKVLQCRAKMNDPTDSETRAYASKVARKVAGIIRREKERKAA